MSSPTTPTSRRREPPSSASNCCRSTTCWPRGLHLGAPAQDQGETAGLLGKEALAKTKPGVIIVNAARGGLIDEHALADAIKSGHVRAAGLDVFSTGAMHGQSAVRLPKSSSPRTSARRRPKPRTGPVPTSPRA